MRITGSTSRTRAIAKAARWRRWPGNGGKWGEELWGGLSEASPPSPLSNEMLGTAQCAFAHPTPRLSFDRLRHPLVVPANTFAGTTEIPQQKSRRHRRLSCLASIRLD